MNNCIENIMIIIVLISLVILLPFGMVFLMIGVECYRGNCGADINNHIEPLLLIIIGSIFICITILFVLFVFIYRKLRWND
jgi:hypothetical protein